jgi:predicted phage-related endonuclease
MTSLNKVNQVQTRLNAKRLINTKQLDYQAWLEASQAGIGSSDAAAACGLNPICRCWNCG